MSHWNKLALIKYLRLTKINFLTIWFDEDVLGNSATDFFFKSSTEYSKKDKSFDEEDLF